MTKELDHKQEVQIVDGKFRVTTTTVSKMEKKRDLNYGHQIVSYEDKGDHYVKEVITEETFEPHEYMRMVSNVRGNKDQLRSQKEMFDQYEEALAILSPHIEKARKMMDEKSSKSKNMGQTLKGGKTK